MAAHQSVATLSMTSANAPAPRAALLLRLNCDLNYVLGKNKNNKHQAATCELAKRRRRVRVLCDGTENSTLSLSFAAKKVSITSRGYKTKADKACTSAAAEGACGVRGRQR